MGGGCVCYEIEGGGRRDSKKRKTHSFYFCFFFHLFVTFLFF